jgi:hypothetical protein
VLFFDTLPGRLVMTAKKCEVCGHEFSVIKVNVPIITAVHTNSSRLMSMDGELYKRFTIRVIHSEARGLLDIEDMLASNPEVKSLYDKLPHGLKDGYSINGTRCELSLYKAKRLAKYMTSNEFADIMEALCKHAYILRVRTGNELGPKMLKDVL